MCAIKLCREVITCTDIQIIMRREIFPSSLKRLKNDRTVLGFFSGDKVINVVSLFSCQSYLKRFGYMDTLKRSGFQSMVSTSKAVKRMQRQMGLEETGELDQSTLAAMKQPRCGVPDVANYKTFDGDLKWDHNDVTYR